MKCMYLAMNYKTICSGITGKGAGKCKYNKIKRPKSEMRKIKLLNNTAPAHIAKYT